MLSQSTTRAASSCTKLFSLEKAFVLTNVYFASGCDLPVFERYYLDPDNKTGCRYLVVDAYNQPVPLAFYEANGFKYMFSSELQECEYRKIESVAKLHTRMMYFDLMLLTN